MPCKVSDVMSQAPVTVDMQDSVQRVEKALVEHNLSSVPVIDAERLDCFGIISLKDIAHFERTKRNSRLVRAWEICSYKPLVVNPETPITEAAQLMVDHGIHHLAVMDKGVLKGYLSSLDVIATYLCPSD